MTSRATPYYIKGGNRTKKKKIAFKPDLDKFNMKCLNADAVDLISKRTYDFAAAMSSAQGK